MKILTDEEIMVINQTAKFDSAIGYARAIEQRIIEKIGEVSCWFYHDQDGFEQVLVTGPHPTRDSNPLYAIPFITEDE